MWIADLIAAAGERLTPAERRLAEAVLADPTLLAFGTASDLAQRAGTSRPTVVRFATKLGQEGFAELQARVRADLSPLLTRPSERIRQSGGAVGRRADVQAAVAKVFDAHAQGRIEELALPLVRAARIWIFSGETSRAGGHALHSGLRMVRAGVEWVEDHSLGRDLGSACTEDAAVVIDFPRYRRSSLSAARAWVRSGVPLVAITDGPLSPLASLTETWLGLDIPAVGPFDSSVPAVVAAELLVGEVTRHLGIRARERIDRIEALWGETETFEPQRG